MGASSDIACSGGEPHPLPLTRRWVEEYIQYWLRNDPCPDLQGLVPQWGGYNNIPAEAWNGYDLAMVEWKRLQRERSLVRVLASAA
jgi:hypothetical protein